MSSRRPIDVVVPAEPPAITPKLGRLLLRILSEAAVRATREEIA